MLQPKVRVFAAWALLLSILGGSTFAMLQPEQRFNSKPSQLAFKPIQESSTNVHKGTNGDIVDAILDGSHTRQQLGNARGGRTIADVLTISRESSLWWSYARDNRDITQRLESRGRNSTVLVPIDKVILGLDKKPHQGDGSPKELSSQFVRAHVTDGPLIPGPNPTLLDGFTIELLQDQNAKGGWKVRPGNVKVLGEWDGENGKVLWLDGILPYIAEK
ncbi:hypothetical protein L204_101757 [Cryptococcus depauperatus]|nr:hypothetical protein L204_04274 [Cryptococcus depauperatus CBS 7855]